MVHIFSVEGNIGSGKSTLVDMLKKSLSDMNTQDVSADKQDKQDKQDNQHKQIIFMQEPVHQWLNIKDEQTKETILSMFYKDQDKYAFSFQMMAYISRVSELKKLVKENPDAIIICERCVLTDKNVFAKMLYDDGKIESVNYQIYLQWFNEFIDDIPINGLIYVKAEPEKSYERVQKRAREGEDIPLEYLKKCCIYHDRWIEKTDTNVLILDANTDFKNTLEDYKEWIKVITQFVTYNSTSKESRHIQSQRQNVDTHTHMDFNKIKDITHC